MEYLAIMTMIFLLLRIVVVMVNYLTHQYLGKLTPSVFPEVVVLIPARNEEESLPVLLSSLKRQNYPSFKVMVYDDYSTDGTADAVRRFTVYDHRFSLVEAQQPPPPGWLGKNFACHCLAEKVAGEYFLFLDADVEVTPELISHAVARMQHEKLHLLSVFPVQRMESPGERLVVPLMNRILLSLLPLILTRYSRRSSLSAANGQMMMFSAEVYRRFRFHKAVKGVPVEDIEIFRLAKKLNVHTHTLLSSGQITCRMYQGFRDSLHGFAKNVLAFFGGSVSVTLLYLFVTTFGWIPLLYCPFSVMWMVFWLIGSILLNVMVSLMSRQSLSQNLFFAIPQQIAFIWLVLKAIRYQYLGGYVWKGRHI